MLRGNGINEVHQGVLEAALNLIFPDAYVIKNAKKAVAIRHNSHYLELDVWYPDLKICFEFQDDYHYHPIWYSQIPLSLVQEKDYAKRNLLLQRRETLIIIPCWWDGSLSSLQATIQFQRPDLLSLHGAFDLIQSNPPLNFFLGNNKNNYPSLANIPGGIQLMLASFQTIDNTEPNQWWLGEKYDGVRCCWIPEEKQMYSRHGLQIYLHSSVNNLFGRIVLDGEIWCGRGMFLESQMCIFAPLEKTNWALFRVVCFDEASRQMNRQLFEQRYSLLLSHFLPEHPTVITASRFMYTTAQSLAQILHYVVEEGGEGIILRRPQSPYLPGRSDSLIKLKASRGDQEALVLNVEEDGSPLLQLADGTCFTVARVDCTLHRRVARGDVVTFTHDFARRTAAQDNAGAAQHAALRDGAETQDGETRRMEIREESASGVPSNPLVYRVRDDVSWGDVIRSSPLPVRLFLNERYQKIGEFIPKPKTSGKNLQDHSTSSNFLVNVQNRRSLFEEAARSMGGDPLIPEFWYSLRGSQLRVFEGMHIAMGRQGFTSSVMHLFPELKLDKRKFTLVQRSRSEIGRAFFNEFAAEWGFDPLVHSNWYNVSHCYLIQFKKYEETLKHNGGSLSTCLVRLYPDIGLQKSNFNMSPQRKQREMVEQVARSAGGDPTDPNFWYSLNPHQLRKKKLVAKGYKKYVRAVTCLFPELRLEKRKFQHYSGQQWEDEKSRRECFDNMAIAQSFDPLVPGNWYKLSYAVLDKHKQCKLIMKQYYEGNLADCLIHLYPDIGLQKPKFNKHAQSKLRGMFERFARAKGGEPSSSDFWYSLDHKELLAFEGMRNFGKYHQEFVAYVIRLFPELRLDKNKFPPPAKWKKRAVREFFDKFASQHSFDPLVATNWYKVSHRSLSQYQSMVKGEKLPDLLRWLYPDVGLQKSRFREYNASEMLEEIVRKKGGNKHDPQFWYTLNPEEFKSFKGMQRFAKYYREYVDVVVRTFPELKLKKSRFTYSVGFWEDADNRREAFIAFASLHSFDPLVPSNWYPLSFSDFASFDETRSMLRYYGGKYVVALMELFPHIKLEPAKFPHVKCMQEEGREEREE